VLVLPPPDPLRDLRKRLEKDYLDLLAVKPEQVRHFLEARVGPFGESLASEFAIDTVEDFLAFEALRLAVFSGATPPSAPTPSPAIWPPPMISWRSGMVGSTMTGSPAPISG
jgi:hypothetical protein